jgi:GntR family transcriptional regulator
MSYIRYDCRKGKAILQAISTAPMPPSHTGDSPAADPAAPATPAFSPLYQQIKSLILQSLESGEWKPGEAIPSEMELAARFRVSQGTVRKAIDELAAENLVVRRQGKGTFVATHSEQQVRYRFLKLVPDSGDEEPAQRGILECRRVRSTAEIARALALRSADAVMQVRRVLTFGSVPTILEDIWLPGNTFQGAHGGAAGEPPGPDLRAVRDRIWRAHGAGRGKDPRRHAGPAAGPVARSAPADAPAEVNAWHYTYHDMPMELRRGLYRTDTHHYRNQT